MSYITGIVLLAIVTALACALPGVFIVLRKNSLVVDAIGHAILPGLVLGFMFAQDLTSPVLLVTAALAGLLVVIGSELLTGSRLVIGDAPQGLIFPALFSVGVILISSRFQDIHLDTHAVLAGDLNVVGITHLYVGGVSIGPRYMWIMLAVLVANALFIALAYRKLTAATFDEDYARSLGIRTGRLNLALMTLTAITVTAAFNAVGAVLVVALVVAPVAIALMLSTRLPVVLGLTLAIAACGAAVGFTVAYKWDAPTSAGIACFLGLLFVLVAGVRHYTKRARLRISGRRALSGV